jgi:hypothetical protein
MYQFQRHHHLNQLKISQFFNEEKNGQNINNYFLLFGSFICTHGLFTSKNMIALPRKARPIEETREREGEREREREIERGKNKKEEGWSLCVRKREREKGERWRRRMKRKGGERGERERVLCSFFVKVK